MRSLVRTGRSMVILTDQEVGVYFVIKSLLTLIAIATSFGIALPSWIVSQESSIWVGVVAVSHDP